MKYYCPNCEKEHESKIITKKETLIVKGQSITRKIKVRVCTSCNEEIIDQELDNKTLQEFYDDYRKKNNLLLPSEIKKIRDKYNLSQASFAKLLGFGEKTITRYENGAIQDLAHDNLIRVMDSIDTFEIVWKLHKDKLNQRENNYIQSLLTNINMQRTNIKIQKPCVLLWKTENNWIQSPYQSEKVNMYRTRRNDVCTIVS